MTGQPRAHASAPGRVPGLNIAQRRHIAIALDRVDEALLQVLAEAAALGGDAGPDRLLRPQTHDVAPDVANRLAQLAAAMRRRIAGDVAALELPAFTELASRRLAAYLTSARVVLADAHARGLRAYGDAHPDVPDAFDPWLVELEEELTRMLALLEEGGDRGAIR